MSFFRVDELLDRLDNPTEKDTIRPALWTVVGYETPSRIVARAVSRVRMIVHWDGFTLEGQVGATSFVGVWSPSSTMAATAMAGTMAKPTVDASPARRRCRLMRPLNTVWRQQLLPSAHRNVSPTANAGTGQRLPRSRTADGGRG